MQASPRKSCETESESTRSIRTHKLSKGNVEFNIVNTNEGTRCIYLTRYLTTWYNLWLRYTTYVPINRIKVDRQRCVSRTSVWDCVVSWAYPQLVRMVSVSSCLHSDFTSHKPSSPFVRKQTWHVLTFIHFTMMALLVQTYRNTGFEENIIIVRTLGGLQVLNADEWRVCLYLTHCPYIIRASYYW